MFFTKAKMCVTLVLIVYLASIFVPQILDIDNVAKSFLPYFRCTGKGGKQENN